MTPKLHRSITPLLLLCALFGSNTTAAQPNILVILADDLGYADLGANGIRSDIATPHLDRIAQSGVRFTDGYATHPFCSPSRAGLMSGMYQHRYGFEHNSGPERFAAPNFGLPREIPTLAEKLKSAGYTTGMVGKWHIGFREGLRPHERGFDQTYAFHSGARSYHADNPRETDPLYRNGNVVAGETGYLTDIFAREAAAFIQRVHHKNHEQGTKNQRPWFLFLSFNAVHDPMEATEAYLARFPHVQDPRRRTLAAMLAAMDDAVGRVMEAVRQSGQEENTLVFFYSDNGGIPAKNASLNEPLRGEKAQVFEGGIRVPFIAQWKGVIPGGIVYPHPVMGFDIHATALAVAGVDRTPAQPDSAQTETTLDGVNLLPYLLGENKERPHQALFWRSARQHAARVGDWKLVSVPGAVRPMIFDLARDISEQNDLAESHSEKLAELQRIYADWDAQMMEPLWIRQDSRNAEPGGRLKTTPNAASQNPGPARGTDRVRAAFERADADGDGKLNREELPATLDFDQIDTDGDGFITLEELRAHIRYRPSATARNPTNASEAAKAEAAPAMPAPASTTTSRTLVPTLSEEFRSWFARLDTDRNGMIEASELEDPREIRGADRNADGKVSAAEARRYFADMQATLAARANPEIYVPWKRTEGQKPLRTAESGDPFLNLRFSKSLPTGERDAHGRLLTGTEVMHLEIHRGMLFATLSGWNHNTKQVPWPGASVAVKKSADAAWELDHNFGKQTGRAASLASIRFTTDAAGKPLAEPVSLLLAGVGGRQTPGKVVVWARDDESGRWVETFAGEHSGTASPEVRVIASHIDSLTGIHHVFAGASNGMLFRGAYDPEAPGRIRWAASAPEISGRERRLMAMAELDGVLYLTVDLEPTQPENGGLFRRIDGTEPRWERVTGWKWSTPDPDTARPWFGMRGLTTVGQTLLGAREQPGTIDRVNPAAPEGERITVDYDLRSALLDAWPFPEGHSGGMTILAYNDMSPVVHPESAAPVVLIPLGTGGHPRGGRERGNPNELGSSSWYLVRYGPGDYGLGQISDPAAPLPNRGSGGLRATRTIRPSPFPEEAGRVWYFGGFDAFGGPTHLNTGWVCRGELPDMRTKPGKARN